MDAICSEYLFSVGTVVICSDYANFSWKKLWVAEIMRVALEIVAIGLDYACFIWNSCVCAEYDVLLGIVAFGSEYKWFPWNCCN